MTSPLYSLATLLIAPEEIKTKHLRKIEGDLLFIAKFLQSVSPAQTK